MIENIATAVLITAALAAAWPFLRGKILGRVFHFDVGHIAVLAALDAEGPLEVEQMLDLATEGRPHDREAVRADLAQILAYCASAGVVEQVGARWRITPQGSSACRLALGDMGLRPRGAGDGTRAS